MCNTDGNCAWLGLTFYLKDARFLTLKGLRRLYSTSTHQTSDVSESSENTIAFKSG
jgi:hypothetical protein